MRTVALAAGESFGVLLAIVDPFANIPIFVSLTTASPTQRRRREAAVIAVLVAVILITFMLVGEPLLRFFGVLESLQIAGGILIAYAGFQMTTDGQELGGFERGPDQAGRGASIALTPMAIPLLAGPGAMGAVAALDARDAGTLKYAGFAAGILGGGGDRLRVPAVRRLDH